MKEIRRLRRWTQMGILMLGLVSVQALGQGGSTTGQSKDTNAVVKTAFISFVQQVEEQREITGTVYPTYAPQIKDAQGRPAHWGAGAAVLVPNTIINALSNNVVAQHTYMGLRADYLGRQAEVSTIGVGAREDFQIVAHNFTLFQEGGANMPFSGFGQQNGALGAVVGGGVYTQFWKSPQTNFVAGLHVDAEKWTTFPGYVMHLGPTLTWKPKKW